ncbi:MAG: hypothetical protein EXR77_00140 [Myxococcales bacterium]|nr:hypothetical protein [Myxococcales bacterium]
MFDGPFQLLNPLRRIAAGQVPGQDFQYFHGILQPYLHTPIYVLAGADVFAAEFSRHATSHIASGLVWSVWLFTLIGRRRALILAPWVLVAVLAAGPVLLSRPSNSLLGMRSALPLLVAAAVAQGRSGSWVGLGQGALTGMALLAGTEQGLATIAAWFLAWWLGPKVCGQRPDLRQLGLWLFGLMASVAVVLGLLTGGDLAAIHSILHYNLILVPTDQFWYFGAPPNKLLANWRDLAHEPLVLAAALGHLALLAVVVRDGLRGVLKPEQTRALLLMGLLGLAGMATFLGYVSVPALVPVARLGLLSGLAWLLWRSHKLQSAVRVAIASPTLGASLQAVATAESGELVGGREFPTAIEAAEPGKGDQQAKVDITGPPSLRLVFWKVASLGLATILVVGLGVRLSSSLAKPPQLGSKEMTWLADATREVHRVAVKGQLPVWSWYAGLLEAELGSFTPSHDYIIHGLGPKGRPEYLAKLRAARPTVVHTFRRDSFEYEDWLQSASWAIYQYLLDHYRPLLRSGLSQLWLRTDPAETAELPLVAVPWQEKDGEAFAKLPQTQTNRSILEVTVHYRAHNPWKALPLFGKVQRWLFTPTGADNRHPVALPDWTDTWTVPVFVRDRTRTVRIHLRSVGLLPGTRLTPLSIQVRERSLTLAQAEVFFGVP